MCFLNLSIRQNSCLKIRRSHLHTRNTFHIKEIRVLYQQVATILLPTQDNNCRSDKQRRLLRKSNMLRRIESQGTMAELNYTWIPFPNVGRSGAVPLFRKKGEHKTDFWMLMPQKQLPQPLVYSIYSAIVVLCVYQPPVCTWNNAFHVPRLKLHKNLPFADRLGGP